MRMSDFLLLVRLGPLERYTCNKMANGQWNEAALKMASHDSDVHPHAHTCKYTRAIFNVTSVFTMKNDEIRKPVI